MGLQVYSHRHSAFVNSFHLADEKWPMTVVNMWQLNELQVTAYAHATENILMFCVHGPKGSSGT